MRNPFYISSIIIPFMIACGNPQPAGKTGNSADTTLVKTQLGNSGYYMSIPAGYHFKATEGPDFIVYYLKPGETQKKGSFQGGFYFGNHPSEPEGPDKCKSEKQERDFLGSETEWHVYDCDTLLIFETVVETHSSEGWNEYIHAFGSASDRAELDKIFEIYSTLRKE